MYSASWSNSYDINAGDTNRNMNAHRASTAPAATSYYSAHPASLMPGHAPRPIHRPELYFTNTAQMPVPYHSYNGYYSPPPPPVPQYPMPHIPNYHQQSLPSPPPPPPRPPRPPPPQTLPLNTLPTHSQPALLPSLPPVPPKPFQSPYSPARPPSPRNYGPTTPSGRDPPSDDTDIALAMALSESISREEQENRQILISEEETQLARALEVSMFEVQSPVQLEFSDTVASSSQASTSFTALTPSPSLRDDEAFARLLAAEQKVTTEAPISVQTSAESSKVTYSKPRTLVEITHPQDNQQNFKSSAHHDTDLPMESQSKTLPLSEQDYPFTSKSDTLDDQSFALLLAVEERRRVTSLIENTPEVQQTKVPPGYFATNQSISPNTRYDDDEALARSLATGECNDLSPATSTHRSEAMQPASEGKLPQYSLTDADSFSKFNCDDDEAFARSLVIKERHASAINAISESHTVSPTAMQGLPPSLTDHQHPGYNVTSNDRATSRLVTSERPDTRLKSTDASAAHPLVSNENPPQYSISDGGKGVTAQASSDKDIVAAHSIASVGSTIPPHTLSRYPTGHYEKEAPATSAASEISSHSSRMGSEAPSSSTLPQEATSRTNARPPLYSLQISSVPINRPSDSKAADRQTPPSPDGCSSSTLVPRQTQGPESSLSTNSSTSPPLYSDNPTSTASSSTTSTPSLRCSSALPNALRPTSEIVSAADSLHPSTPPFSRHHSLHPSSAQVGPSSIRNNGPSDLSTPHNEPLDSPQLRPSSSVLNFNALVDRELFNGVTLGFMAPKISDQMTQMLGEMPLIITLPYGKARPLHLQGPSWKHLLKLMAKLSGTRVEPSIDAITVTKTPPKLRTVIQFVKPHHDSPTWCTVFYFTIEYPSPQPIRNAGVNDLPYSYSLAGIPTLLRDAADSPLSKTYTIPASETVPHPNLPITFPELALYLQAALDESRRYLNDTSSGNRKLAKMIDVCYPTEDYVLEPPNRSSVGGLFKRVMGLSTKPNRRGGNEEIFEFVTPFDIYASELQH